MQSVAVLACECLGISYELHGRWSFPGGPRDLIPRDLFLYICALQLTPAIAPPDGTPAQTAPLLPPKPTVSGRWHYGSNALRSQDLTQNDTKQNNGGPEAPGQLRRTRAQHEEPTGTVRISSCMPLG